MTIPFRWHCQQICQQPSSERVKKGLAELEGISLVSDDKIPDSIDDLRLFDWLSSSAGEDLTTQAQRPGARDATMATTTLPPGSLQRMVRPLCAHPTKNMVQKISIGPPPIAMRSTRVG